MKLTVLTTVIGRTDRLRTPTSLNPEVEYVCYTDDLTLRVSGWRMVPVVVDEDPVKVSRRIKILAHEYVPPYPDVICWMDAAFELAVDPVQIAQRWLWTADIMALAHPDRTNFEDEGAELIRLGRAPAALIEAQIAAYHEAGYSREIQKQITSTGLSLRRNSPRVRYFHRRWWDALEAAGHTRDQMSIDFVAWRTGIDIAYLTGHYRNNPYARWFPQR